MKDSKADNSSCHQEHVMILNSLTESLRDELKRGLGLMDTCVNQLAQAKWILINVEKTIEDAYATCPACDSSGRKKHDGHVPASPRTSVSATTVNLMSTPTNGTFREDDSAKKGSKSVAKKANVLPMVSGHTIHKPNINISRVEPKLVSKKTKKQDPPTPSTSRNRTSIGRGMGSALLARATAAAKSGNVSRDSDDEGDKESVTSSKNRSQQPAPEVATEEEVKTGDAVGVALTDIHEKLEGRVHIVGSELVQFMKSLGLPVNFKVKDRSQKLQEVGLTSDKSDSGEDESISSKKKSRKRRDDTESSKKVEPSKPAAPPLNFATLLTKRMELLAKSTTTEELSKKISAVAEGGSRNDSDSDSKKSAKSPDRKRVKYGSGESDAEVTSKPSKRMSRTASSAAGSGKLRHDSDDSDDQNTSFRSRRKPAGKTKRKDSDDDSDFEVEKTRKQKSRSRAKAKIPAKKTSGKFKSKELLSDSDDSSVSNNNTATKKKTKDAVWSTDSEAGSKRKSSAPRENSESPPSKSATTRPGPASQKSKRTGPRPGPLSRKQPVETDATKESDPDDIKNDGKTGSNVQNSPEDAKEGMIKIASSKAIFSDTDSDDSEIAKIKQSIPLNLQDAVRSPSPTAIPLNSSSVFSRLLQAHNPSSTTWDKLRRRCSRVNSKVMELNEELQDKLGKAGKLLKPYDGTFSAADAPFETGRYYVVGEPGDERLVLYERDELQVLDMDDEELNDLSN